MVPDTPDARTAMVERLHERLLEVHHELAATMDGTRRPVPPEDAIHRWTSHLAECIGIVEGLPDAAGAPAGERLYWATDPDYPCPTCGHIPARSRAERQEEPGRAAEETKSDSIDGQREAVAPPSSPASSPRPVAPTSDDGCPNPNDCVCDAAGAPPGSLCGFPPSTTKGQVMPSESRDGRTDNRGTTATPEGRDSVTNARPVALCPVREAAMIARAYLRPFRADAENYPAAADIYTRLDAALATPCPPTAPEPTVEPSDAAIRAARDVYVRATEMPEPLAMRLALRAAYAAQFGPAAPSGELQEGR